MVLFAIAQEGESWSMFLSQLPWSRAIYFCLASVFYNQNYTAGRLPLGKICKALQVRVGWFWTKMLHFLWCAKVLLDINSKFSIWNVALAWRRASENDYCYPKMGIYLFIYLSFYKASKMCSLSCLKAINEEKLKLFWFFLCPSLKPFCQTLWGPKIKF